MQIDVICKVIDNFGDAGFCLRLARALTKQGHCVRLYHDNSQTFKKLHPHKQENLILIDGRVDSDGPQTTPPPDLIIEPFGTSSEQTLHRFDLSLKAAFPSTPWLLVDYLSAESWVEDFHLKESIDPKTGHVSTYFYPGFTPKTGGLIHCDLDPACVDKKNLEPGWPERGVRIFVFAYQDAPFAALLNACKKDDELTIATSSGFAPPNDHRISTSPFVSQDRFDALLAKHDVLFVRGEDSFVRAQLLGKPFVWQIYPTADNQHLHKLDDFLAIYLMDAEPGLANAIRNVWQCWNQPSRHSGFGAAWETLAKHDSAWFDHASRWQQRLIQGPELVGEILTWRFGGTPTLTK